eukprot:6194091-Pleurochrysis_carterae.AAC.3
MHPTRNIERVQRLFRQPTRGRAASAGLCNDSSSNACPRWTEVVPKRCVEPRGQRVTRVLRVAWATRSRATRSGATRSGATRSGRADDGEGPRHCGQTHTSDCFEHCARGCGATSCPELSVKNRGGSAPPMWTSNAQSVQETRVF